MVFNSWAIFFVFFNSKKLIIRYRYRQKVAERAINAKKMFDSASGAKTLKCYEQFNASTIPPPNPSLLPHLPFTLYSILGVIVEFTGSFDGQLGSQLALWGR